MAGTHELRLYWVWGRDARVVGCGAAWSFGWGDLLRGVERLRSAPRTRSKEPRVYVSECDLYEYMFDSSNYEPLGGRDALAI